MPALDKTHILPIGESATFHVYIIDYNIIDWHHIDLCKEFCSNHTTGAKLKF